MAKIIAFALFAIAIFGAGHAATYPATKQWMPSSFPADGWFNAQDAACFAQKSHTSWTLVSSGSTDYDCTYWDWQGAGPLVASSVLAVRLHCLNGGTQQGSECVKECPAGTTMDEYGACNEPSQCQPSQILRDGQCVCDPAHLAAFPTAYGQAMEGTGSMPDSACVGGCIRKTGSFCLGGGGTWWCEGGAWTTETCQGGATDKKMPPNKKPPCAATEGVLTSSSGTVACVPEGTPSARKPGVTKEKQLETYPDGSKKETEKITTRDPATNATDTSVTTTTTAGPTGGTQAGTPGTTSSDSSKSGTGTGGNGNGDEGDGDCDPTLNFCGGPKPEKLYDKKEKTADSVLSKFKDDVMNTDFGKGAGAFFNVQMPSGSCGSGLSANIPFLNAPIDLAPYFCSPEAQQIMEAAGAVVRLVVAFVAFTWAFL